jgi:hypothetical protein
MPRLALEDRNGRVDVLLARLAEKTAEHVGKGEAYRDSGISDVIEEAIRRTVPNKAFSPIEIADKLGLLPKKTNAKGSVRRVR